MANPIAFTPVSMDPSLELQSRLAAAPRQHAEALLVAYDLLGEAHRQGILDALQGLVGSRDKIMGTLSDYAAQPLGIQAMRNALAIGRLLGTLDPNPISHFSKEAQTAMETHRQEKGPPSLWQIFKRLRQPETRRGLSFLTLMLGALGRASQ
jgi:uncharacterized protein YjgD (DUF1641 family)